MSVLYLAIALILRKGVVNVRVAMSVVILAVRSAVIVAKVTQGGPVFGPEIMDNVMFLRNQAIGGI